MPIAKAQHTRARRNVANGLAAQYEPLRKVAGATGVGGRGIRSGSEFRNGGSREPSVQARRLVAQDRARLKG